MEKYQIRTSELSKIYRVPVRAEGLAASMRHLIKPTFDYITAVEDVNLTVQKGEMIGLIGPNGAGKTTTLKILAGLIHPSRGEALVSGFIPWKRDPAFLCRISMVMGNKSQMLWDIPPMDSFRVISEIYSVPKDTFRQTIDELIEILEMREILTKPVRNLSLGERMKCEIVASLLYKPEVLFLDEPTLGLDVSMQIRLRSFIAEYNRRSNVTVILTSHYMADVTALCSRVVLIHHGRMLYDGNLQELAKKLAPFKQLRITLQEEKINGTYNFPEGVEIVEQAANNLVLRVKHASAPAMTAQLLQILPVVDLTIEDPPIEAVMDQIYSEGDL